MVAQAGGLRGETREHEGKWPESPLRTKTNSDIVLLNGGLSRVESAVAPDLGAAMSCLGSSEIRCSCLIASSEAKALVESCDEGRRNKQDERFGIPTTSGPLRLSAGFIRGCGRMMRRACDCDYATSICPFCPSSTQKRGQGTTPLKRGKRRPRGWQLTIQSETAGFCGFHPESTSTLPFPYFNPKLLSPSQKYSIGSPAAAHPIGDEQ